jgi:acyl-CoA dehydrogenase
MPHLYTDEQRQIRVEARRLLEERYSGAALKALLKARGQYDTGFRQACRDMGWTAIAIPEEHGGLGLGPVELGIIAEECGRAACGAPFLTTSFALSEAVRLWGDAAQKQHVLPGIAAGDAVGAFAFAEGADILPAVPGVRFRDGRLHGVKTGVVAGAVADTAVVLATTDRGSGLFLTDLGSAGVARAAAETFDNSRCIADLTFDGAPATALNAEDGVAAAGMMLSRAAVVVAFEQVGGADACMEQARDYANERQAFGQPIGKFQAIKHRIAEMYVANELARGNALRAAIDLAEGAADLPLHAAAARLSATGAYEFAAREAIQVHGAIGVTWEHDLHLHYRRSRSLALELGSVLFWEDTLADALKAAA